MDRNRRTFDEAFSPSRNGLNAVRLVLAAGVIVWHSFPLTGHVVAWAPVAQILGHVWVDAFFAISGFLIVSSWIRDPHPGRFLSARLLRIFPAFWVCLVATALVAAPLMTGQFGAANVDYVLQNALLRMNQYDIAGSPQGVPYPGVWNGSLWTLMWEFFCYLGVLVLGIAGVLGRRWTLAVVYVSATVGVLLASSGAVDNWWFANGARFALMFSAGALMYRYRRVIPLNRWVVLLAVAVLTASSFLPDYSMLAAPAIAYLALTAGAVLRHPAFRLRNDISYGMYIYAFPTQQILVLSGVRDVPLLVGLSLVLTALPATLSWFLVERPAMRLRKRIPHLSPPGGVTPPADTPSRPR